MRLRLRIWTTCFILAATAAAQQTQQGPVRVEVAPANASILQNTSKQFSASRVFIGGLNKPGSGKNISSSAKWFSDKQSIVLINPTTGLAQGVGLGTANITAVCGPFRGSTMLTVHGLTCGDGVRDGAEQCDDGNTTNLDGCNAVCNFEQNQRANSITMQFAQDTTCTADAFGGAFVNNIAQGQLQTAINSSVKSGATSLLFAMLGITDLTGTNQPAFNMGILSGSPVAAPSGTIYDGANDLDWWYTPDPLTIDGTRTPNVKLAASITAKSLAAGPGTITFPFPSGSSIVNLSLSQTRIKATVGATSTPLVSSNQGPPGHLASENLDPALQSYASMTAGSVCGNTSAQSLAGIPLPSNITQTCTAYSASNSFLDLIVGGCTALGIIQIVKPTQPDTSDPSAPLAGAGPPYTLSASVGKTVNTCKDKLLATVPLAACLNSAAYSSYFKFTSDRVIIK